MRQKLPHERWELTGLVLLAVLVILPTVVLSLISMSTLRRAQAAFEREIRDAYAKSVRSVIAQSTSRMEATADKARSAVADFAKAPTPDGRLAVSDTVRAAGLVILDSRWKVVYPRRDSRAEAPPADPALSRDLDAALAIEATDGPSAALPLYKAVWETASAMPDCGGALGCRVLAAIGRTSLSVVPTEAISAYQRLAAMPDSGGELSLPLLARYQIWRLTGAPEDREGLLQACFDAAFTAPRDQLLFYLQSFGPDLDEGSKALFGRTAAILSARATDERYAAAAQYSVSSGALTSDDASADWAWRSVVLGGTRLLCGSVAVTSERGRSAAVLFLKPSAVANAAIGPALASQTGDGAVHFSLLERPADFDRAAREGRLAMKGRNYDTYDLKLEGWMSDDPRLIMALPFPEPFDFWAVAVSSTGGSVDDLARSRIRIMTWALLLTALMIIAGAASVFIWARRRANLARLQTDFVANVTHELKTPLTGIRSLAETVQLGRLSAPERQAEFLGSIISETERLGRLINNVLDFSRFERGAERLHFERTDLADLVDVTVDRFRATLPASEADSLGVTLPAEPLYANLDADSITGALWNLLDNAFKYSRPPRGVLVSLAASDGLATISVADNGIGLAPRDVRRIFKKFYRVDTSLSAETQGAGLGLSLVKAYVKAHGGSVRVESKPGAGSTFFITLPIGNGEA
jgi:signal transduction histidine kinase